MILNDDPVLLDVIDPEKKKKLDDGAEPGDIWHDDDRGDDDDDDDDMEMVKGTVFSTRVLDTLQGHNVITNRVCMDVLSLSLCIPSCCL